MDLVRWLNASTTVCPKCHNNTLIIHVHRQCRFFHYPKVEKNTCFIDANISSLFTKTPHAFMYDFRKKVNLSMKTEACRKSKLLTSVLQMSFWKSGLSQTAVFSYPCFCWSCVVFCDFADGKLITWTAANLCKDVFGLLETLNVQPRHTYMWMLLPHARMPATGI